MTDILSTFIALFPVTLAQSLILGFVVLAIMIPFRILSFPDLTSEGAFPLGGVVCTVSLVAGLPPLLAVALIAKEAAGCMGGVLCLPMASARSPDLSMLARQKWHKACWLNV